MLLGVCIGMQGTCNGHWWCLAHVFMFVSACLFVSTHVMHERVDGNGLVNNIVSSLHTPVHVCVCVCVIYTVHVCACCACCTYMSLC